MRQLLNCLVFLFIVTVLMGTQCNKYDNIEPPKQGFAEKINLSPAQKTYSINDTIWLNFQTPSKTLFDTISNQRLSSSSVKFLFNIALLAKYDYPTVSSGNFCDFILPSNVAPNTRTSQNATATSFEVGCDNAPNYDIKVGVVLRYKGVYILDMSSATPLLPCAGQVNPYPSSYIRFTYNVNDTNKDVYLSIPASARNEYPSGLTERQLDAKVAYAFRVQ